MWTRNETGSKNQRGAALLAVLWLSAILAAIAFSLATTVRGETERTSTLTEGVRGYYFATGALERALAYIEWGPSHRKPDNTARYFEPGMARLNFNFPLRSQPSRSYRNRRSSISMPSRPTSCSGCW